MDDVVVPAQKLNVFQKLTRQWDALHPYNAAQLMRLPGYADASAIEANWRWSLSSLGLGEVSVFGSTYRFSPASEHHSLLDVLPDDTDLETFLSREMNRPFEAKGGMPFRPFVLPSGDHHYFGVVYHHWIADSVSIRQLLRQWTIRHYSLPDRPTLPNRRTDGSGYWQLFGPDARRWDLLGSVLGIGRWSSRLKRARRIESDRFPDMNIRFKLHRLAGGLPTRLLATARECGATLNDLFLAAMGEACDRYVAAPANPRRSALALGVIADLRGSSPELADAFNLYLGFTNVLCSSQALRDWPSLVQSIAEQSQEQKRAHGPESSMMRMAAGLVTGRLLSRRRLLEFYRKRLPLAAGISNVNLNRTWVAKYHPDPIEEYIRVSPTGPMLPLVFTPTTLGDGMHFGLTHRESVVSPTVADHCASDFSGRLMSLTRPQPMLKMPRQREAS